MTLEALQVLRLRLHRLDPARPLPTARAAAAFVRQRGLVMAGGRSSLPVLAEAIVGRQIRGAWMADREVFRIYRILRAVRRFGVLSASLILGKDTLIWRTLAPSVERIASDPQRRARAEAHLPPLARRLLRDAGRRGELRMDRWDAPHEAARKARLVLERELLVYSRSLHTERGYHTALVVPWPASPFSRRFSRRAARIEFPEAQRALLQAALAAAVVAPEREVRRWFVFGAGPLDAMIDEGTVRRLVAGRVAWLTVTGTAGRGAPG